VNAQIWLAASTAKDWRDGSTYDLWIAGVAALCLIIIMLIITRSLIAALVIVGTVALSLGASFGMSVLLWQYILGIQLHWMVLAMSVIVLLAVGSDYNLLLVSRMKEDRRRHKHRHDPRDGRYWQGRDDCGTGVRRHHGLVVVSDLRIIGQIGTTIGLGLLFDTVIVRSFMTPSIAAVFGRWFWWPQRVRRGRPVSCFARTGRECKYENCCTEMRGQTITRSLKRFPAGLTRVKRGRTFGQTDNGPSGSDGRKRSGQDKRPPRCAGADRLLSCKTRQ
jgi:RND superfamily putative drug exporter